ncbi:MAG: J domain-containing protein [Deltaproteobacteria bacterium]|nr:J domain-containing protein [Deltaproteobacteria bacterium]
MSIGKRFVDLMRSNLNALLDRAGDGGHAPGGRALEELSDRELEAEMARRRQRREAAERGAARSVDAQARDEVEEALRQPGRRPGAETRREAGPQPRSTGNAGSTASAGRGGAGGPQAAARPRPAGQDERIARLYAQLECPYGADQEAVRKQYRVLMRKYHPDMHSGDPEKQRLATDLSQRLTTAYNELRRLLSTR